MTLEVSLENRACAYLIARGAMPIKRGQDGEPDREVLWGRSLHFWLEFKKPPEQDKKMANVRPRQILWAKYLRAIGDTHLFVDSFSQVVQLVETWEIIYGSATASRDAALACRQ